MVAAALLTAGASIISGLIGSKANKDASQAASQANEASIAEAKRQFDLIRQDTAPYREAGGQSIDFLRRLLLGGAGGGGGGGGGGNASQIANLEAELAGLRTSGSSGGRVVVQRGGRDGSTVTLNGKAIHDVQQREVLEQIRQTQTGGKHVRAGTYQLGDSTGAGFSDPSRAAQIEAQLASLRSGGGASVAGIDPNALDLEAISPGYNFRLAEGEKGIARAQSSRKDRFSGRQMKELLRYGQDYASSEFAPFVDRLFRLGGYGSSAVGTSANAGLNTANQIATANARTGNAQAAGTIGAAQSWNNAIQGGLSNYMFNEYLNNPISAGGYTSLGGGR